MKRMVGQASLIRLLREREILRAELKTCLESLDAIAEMPRKGRAARLAVSTATFIRECSAMREKLALNQKPAPETK
jgi:hypothetical protein